MPTLSYHDIARLTQLQTDIQKHQTIPIDITVLDLAHLVLFPHHTSTRDLLTQNIPLFIQVILHDIHNPLHRLQDESYVDYFAWISNIIVPTMQSWVTTKHISTEWLPLLPAISRFRQQFKPPITGYDLKRTMLESDDPYYLAFCVSVLDRSVCLQSGLQKTYEHILTLNDEALLSFIKYMAHHHTDFLRGFCLNSPKLKPRLAAILATKAYSLTQYKILYPVLKNTFSLNKVQLKPTDMSIEDIMNELMAGKCFEENNQPYELAKTAFSFKNIASMTMDDVRYCLTSNQARSFIAQLSAHFDQCSTDIQKYFFEMIHHYKIHTSSYDFNAKTFFLEKMEKNAHFVEAISPMFGNIARHEPLTQIRSVRYLEPYLRIWFKKHHPEFLKTMKILGITSTNQMLNHYHESIKNNYQEISLHI